MLVLFVSTDQATTVTYTLSLHDALPICYVAVSRQKSTVPSTIRIVDWNGRVLADLATTTTSDINRVERSEEHTSELRSRVDLVCRLLLEKKKNLIDQADPVPQLVGRGRV